MLVAAVIGMCACPAGRAPATCEALADARLVDGRDPAALWAAGVAEAVAGGGVTGGEDRPRVATIDLGVATGAWYCHSSDTIYLSRALTTYSYLGRACDGADLLAFVVAHELAHRREHRTAAASEIRGFALAPSAATEREAAADARAAGLLAGVRDPWSRRCFSPWKLVRRRTLERYLVDEVGVDPESPEWSKRRAALRGALTHVDAEGSVPAAAALAAPVRVSARTLDTVENAGLCVSYHSQ